MIGTLFNWVFMILNVISGAYALATYDTHHSKVWVFNIMAASYLAALIDSKWRMDERKKHKRQLGGKR